jgi:hypothetical protein
MPASDSKRSRGRPREGSDLKCAPLNVRTSPILRRRIDEARAKSGRSLAQEVECRLHLSFDLEDDERLRAIAHAALEQGTGKDNEEGSDNGDRN